MKDVSLENLNESKDSTEKSVRFKSVSKDTDVSEMYNEATKDAETQDSGKQDSGKQGSRTPDYETQDYKNQNSKKQDSEKRDSKSPVSKTPDYENPADSKKDSRPVSKSPISKPAFQPRSVTSKFKPMKRNDSDDEMEASVFSSKKIAPRRT